MLKKVKNQELTEQQQERAKQMLEREICILRAKISVSQKEIEDLIIDLKIKEICLTCLEFDEVEDLFNVK